MSGDGYKPVRPEDVTDLALLPRRFDQFVMEMRTAFESIVDKLADKILPAIEEVKDELRLQRKDISDLQTRVAALEAARKPKRKARR